MRHVLVVMTATRLHSTDTAQKMEFSIKNFFSKRDQIRSHIC